MAAHPDKIISPASSQIVAYADARGKFVVNGDDAEQNNEQTMILKTGRCRSISSVQE